MPLLVQRNCFLVLELGLDIVVGVRCLKVQGDGLACDYDDKDDDDDDDDNDDYDHRQKSSLEPLVVWRNYFLVLDLGIDIVNGARCFEVQGGGLACERLDEDMRSWR